MIKTIGQAPLFEFTGNWLCLDFVNTVNDRLTDNPREMFNSYADLVVWGQQAQIVTDEGAQHLLEQAASHPDDASTELQRALAFCPISLNEYLPN